MNRQSDASMRHRHPSLTVYESEHGSGFNRGWDHGLRPPDDRFKGGEAGAHVFANLFAKNDSQVLPRKPATRRKENPSVSKQKKRWHFILKPKTYCVKQPNIFFLIFFITHPQTQTQTHTDTHTEKHRHRHRHTDTQSVHNILKQIKKIKADKMVVCVGILITDKRCDEDGVGPTHTSILVHSASTYSNPSLVINEHPSTSKDLSRLQTTLMWASLTRLTK